MTVTPISVDRMLTFAEGVDTAFASTAQAIDTELAKSLRTMSSDTQPSRRKLVSQRREALRAIAEAAVMAGVLVEGDESNGKTICQLRDGDAELVYTGNVESDDTSDLEGLLLGADGESTPELVRGAPTAVVQEMLSEVFRRMFATPAEDSVAA